MAVRRGTAVALSWWTSYPRIYGCHCKERVFEATKQTPQPLSAKEPRAWISPKSQGDCRVVPDGTPRNDNVGDVAQEDPTHGCPRNPKGIATSCLSALLAMTTWKTQRKRTQGMVIPEIQRGLPRRACGVSPNGNEDTRRKGCPRDDVTRHRVCRRRSACRGKLSATLLSAVRPPRRTGQCTF